MKGLDDDCPTCGRTSGDHTLREWATCLGESTTLPFEPIPDDAAAAANAALQKRFGLEDGVIMADNVIVRAAALDFHSGIVEGNLPALIQDFQVSGGPGGSPVDVAKIVFVAPGVDGMRAYGRLVRDSANGAAKRSEGR